MTNILPCSVPRRCVTGCINFPRASLSSGTTLKSLNEKICQFYGHPAVKKARQGYSADRFAGFALGARNPKSVAVPRKRPECP